MEQQLFTVIGLSDGRELFLPPHIERIIRNGEVFSGGVRHRQIMENHLPHGALWIDITTPLDDVFRSMPVILTWWYLLRVIRCFLVLPQPYRRGFRRHGW